MIMFEHKSHPLLPRHLFFRRMLFSALLGLVLVAVSLAIGMMGYHYYESMSWVDAFVNAAMILSGMGPLLPINTYGGKVFAGFYAIYSGIALISIAGIIFAPVFHRFLHKFHLENKNN
jgi:hypothetical protein